MKGWRLGWAEAKKHPMVPWSSLFLPCQFANHPSAWMLIPCWPGVLASLLVLVVFGGFHVADAWMLVFFGRAHCDNSRLPSQKNQSYPQIIMDCEKHITINCPRLRRVPPFFRLSRIMRHPFGQPDRKHPSIPSSSRTSTKDPDLLY